MFSDEKYNSRKVGNPIGFHKVGLIRASLIKGFRILTSIRKPVRTTNAEGEKLANAASVPGLSSEGRERSPSIFEGECLSEGYNAKTSQ